MCTDYTDLNKTCPKDPYPLPSIDKLVDDASGHALLSLMDAYSGYNQIRMHPEDEPKTALYGEKANYCYRTMPFGLKNAGATYQRLMDIVFAKQMGRNMEAYVDDMVVKTLAGDAHRLDLEEAFGELRKHNVRLNPKKCMFCIQSSNFLGFMISQQGIEANPEKCQAIKDMRSPTSVREVQKLAGRIAALSCFLPHSGKISAPFFKCHRKSATFQWTYECEDDFSRLKCLLSTPPVMTKPNLDAPLILYLAVTDVVVSSFLVQESEGQQNIIYFVSRALQGVELRYQKIEKADFALAVTARRLRPYFQSCQVIVRTNLPLK